MANNFSRSNTMRALNGACKELHSLELSCFSKDVKVKYLSARRACAAALSQATRADILILCS